MDAEENKRDSKESKDSSDDETDDNDANFDVPSTAGGYNDRHPSEDQPSDVFLTDDIPPFPLGLKRQRAIGVIHHIQNVDLPPAPPRLMRQNAQAGPLPQDAPRANTQVVRGFESFPKSD